MDHAIRKGECQSRPKNIRYWDGLSATANLAVQREVPEGMEGQPLHPILSSTTLCHKNG